MSKLIHSECFDWHTRQAFALGGLDEETTAELLRHMATCQACSSSVGQLREEVEDARHFDARAHGNAWRREEVAQALAAAIATAAGGLRGMLERWARQGARAATKVRTVGRGTPQMLRWIAIGFEPLTAGAGPEPTRGAVRTRGGLSSARPGEWIDIPLGKGRFARCAVEERLIVRFTGDFSGTPPLVLVVPESGRAPFGLLGELQYDNTYEVRADAPAGDFTVIPGPVGE